MDAARAVADGGGGMRVTFGGWVTCAECGVRRPDGISMGVCGVGLCERCAELVPRHVEALRRRRVQQRIAGSLGPEHVTMTAGDER